MVGGGLRFNLDGVEHEGEGAGVVLFFGIKGGELLVNNGDFRVKPCGEEKLVTGAGAVTISGKQFAVKEARFEAVRVFGEEVAISGSDVMKEALDLARLRILLLSDGIEFLFPFNNVEESVFEEGPRKGCGGRGFRWVLRRGRAGSEKNGEQES